MYLKTPEPEVGLPLTVNSSSIYVSLEKHDNFQTVLTEALTEAWDCNQSEARSSGLNEKKKKKDNS